MLFPFPVRSKLFLFLVFCAIAQGVTSAQQVNDRVVVTASVYTKILQEKVDKVWGGEIDTITEINGKWCALSRSKGWLPMQYVMNLDMGEKYYAARIEKDARDFDALATRGMIRFEKDMFEDAMKDLNTAIGLNPENPVMFNNRGIVLNAMGQFPAAMANLDQAIKLNPIYADAHENKGLVTASMGQHKEAIKSYDKAIALRKDNPWSYINRGTAKSNAGDYLGAKTDFSTSIKMNKKISDPYVGLSVVYLAEGNLDKAYRFADEAIKRNERSGLAYVQRGWTNYKKEKLDEAIYDFDQAIRFAPKLSIAFNNRGICHTDKGNHEQAIKDLKRAVALNPNSAITHMNRGTAYMAAKDYDNAIKDLRKAVKLSPKLSDAAHALGWFLATCPDEKFRDGKEAKAEALRACELNEWKEWSYIDSLAAAEAEAGDFEKAMEYEQKAMDLAPEDAQAECNERLESYKAKNPWRSEFGKPVEQQPAGQVGDAKNNDTGKRE